MSRSEARQPSTASYDPCVFRAVRLVGFRNLSSDLIELSDGLNVFEGQNGQGKTNFLEAISLLAGLRSFRGANFRQMVHPDRDNFLIEARVRGADGEEHVVQQEWTTRGKKVRLDDRPVRRSSALLALFPTILFGPEDLDIAKGAPGVRRAFMNEGMIQCTPEDHDVLQTYQQIIKSRNKALKNVQYEGLDSSVLRVFTEQWIEQARKLSASRQRFLERFRPVFQEVVSELTQEKHSGDLHLRASSLHPEIETIEDPRGLQEELDRRDLVRGNTTTGPHRDELVIELDGHDIQGWASQGQNRLIVITLKIALLRLVADLRKCQPVLMLDDVSSELDAQRSQWLSDHLRLQGGQVLATTTDAKAVGLSSGAISQYRVWSGGIDRSSESETVHGL